MNNSLKQNINCIRQTAENRYRIILDFATVKIRPFLISKEYKYVWVYNHNPTTNNSWTKRNLPILNGVSSQHIMSKNLSYDFIIETKEFLKLIPNWNAGIQMVQMNKIPPDYLDLTQINGNQRYQILLTECDYLFDLEIPSATDYGTLISSKLDYMERLIESKQINWRNLP